MGNLKITYKNSEAFIESFTNKLRWQQFVDWFDLIEIIHCIDFIIKHFFPPKFN